MVGIRGLLIIPLLLAILVAYLLDPFVSYLEKQRISRGKGIAIVYILLITVLLLLSLNFIPKLLQELQELVLALPEYTEKLMLFVEKMGENYHRFNLPDVIRSSIDESLVELQRSLTINLEKFSLFILLCFSQAFALFLVPLFSYYLLRDNANFKKRFLGLIPEQYRINMEETLRDINKTLGAYLRGVFVNSFSVGAMLYLGLLILGVKFALFLGIINALTNVIPYFGPIIGAVPVVLIALLQSPALAWKVLLLIIIVQQIESQFIAPQVFGRSMGFHPLTVIIALLLGGLYMGFTGLIIIIPLAAITRAIFRYFSPVVIHALKRRE
ncbi:MAG: AI-2E family transporter [Bacillota bacterium]|nr:AI-2E family transporter [Bacillota bacterium]